MGNHGATPPPPSPRSPTSARGTPETGHGPPALNPLLGRGDASPPPERAALPRGWTLLSLYATRPQAPTCLLPHGPRQESEPEPAHRGATRTTPGDNTRTRTGAVWGPRHP